MNTLGIIFGIAFAIAYLVTAIGAITLLVKCVKRSYFDEDEEDI